MAAAIEVKNLTKQFPSFKNPQGIKEWAVNAVSPGRRIEKNYFTAVNNLNFTVEKGECLGIIGKNGAGKSTLLSLLLGTSCPTAGEVVVSGKRTPLLELGAGFHPDLTGRENILLNAVLLGLTRDEALSREGKIIAFSEIEQFIDMPVRTYSSGMYLRLAFSVAIHADPEIFLIDEILAVGDESFQKKSGDALLNLIHGGVTTVFVSHNMDAVKKISNRVLWVDHGTMRESGDPSTVVDRYLKEGR